MEDTRLKRFVALKFLPDEVAKDSYQVYLQSGKGLEGVIGIRKDSLARQIICDFAGQAFAATKCSPAAVPGTSGGLPCFSAFPADVAQEEWWLRESTSAFGRDAQRKKSETYSQKLRS